MHRCTAPSLVFVAAIGAASLGEQRAAREREHACVSAPTRAPSPPPLMTLRTRDHEVAVYGGNARDFTVLDDAGVVLAERIDEDTFAARFPDLHAQLEAAFAGERGWVLDASVTAPSRRDGTAAAGP